jgi:hypothetical protein
MGLDMLSARREGVVSGIGAAVPMRTFGVVGLVSQRQVVAVEGVSLTDT